MIKTRQKMLPALIDRVKKHYNAIPVEVKRILIKAAVLIIFWQVLYTCYLEPYQVIDPFMTRITTAGSAWLLNFFYTNHHATCNNLPLQSIIYIDNNPRLSVIEVCNAVDLEALFIGLLICIPAKIKNMLIFGTIGVVGICLLNIIRCAALAYLNNIHYAFVDIAHHYLFSLIVYTFIFIVWVQYVKFNFRSET